MSKNNKPLIIPLSFPLVSGEDTIKTVELRKPKAGELRGLQLASVLQLDVDTINTLVPRLCSLTERDMQNLEMEDYTDISTGLLGFFVNTAPDSQI